MGQLTIKRWGAAVAVAVAVTAGAASANMIWSGKSTSNENDWGGYVYYYLEGNYNTDATATKTEPQEHRPCFATFNCRYAAGADELERILSAEEADGFGEWPYKPKLGGGAPGGGGNPLYLEVIGLSAPDAKYIVNPEVGMGLLLSSKAGGDNPIGIGDKFKNVTKIKWKMKAEGITEVRFAIETTETVPVGLQNSFGKIFTVTTSWDSYEVTLGSNAQCKPGLHADKGYPPTPEAGQAASSETTQGKYPDNCAVGDLKLGNWFGRSYVFKPENVIKIKWHAATSGGTGTVDFKNTALGGGGNGKLWVDQVEIVGMDFVPEQICGLGDCVGNTLVKAPDGGFKLSDFDSEPNKGQNTKGHYWYYYDDHADNGTANVTGFTKPCDEPGDYETCLNLDNTLGIDNTAGASLTYELGGMMTGADGSPVKSFAGIGTDIFSFGPAGGLDTVPYKAEKTGDGIFFNYKTSFGADYYLTVEVHDDYAIKHPKGGEVYHVQIPGTAGAWKSATVMFSRLKLPSWAPKDRKGGDVAFNRNKIYKVQFVSNGTDGTFTIDNVYLLDNDNVGIKTVAGAAKSVGMRATYNKGVVGVNWEHSSAVASGKISLVNTKGRVVASVPIVSAGSKVAAKLNAGKMPTGMYFVRVNAKDVNGRKIVQNAPISIVK